MKTYYKIEGSTSAPVLILSHSLGCTLNIWNDIVPGLLPFFCILRYDTLGHGHSIKPTGPYTIEQLGKQVIELMDFLHIEKAQFGGISMGGMVAIWLGINYPERFEGLILCHTAANIGTKDRWEQRIEQVANEGMEPLTTGLINTWFTDEYQERHPKRMQQYRKMISKNDRTGYIACCEAIRDADFSEDLKNIKTKTLVIVGDQDAVTTIEHGQYLTQHIPGSSFQIVKGKHLAGIEKADEFTNQVVNFLIGPSVFERGMHIRRSVLGKDHVEKSALQAKEFSLDFQEFITRYAWGEVWARPGLSQYNRSLVTLGLLIVLNRKPEFQMHVKAALNNGVSVEEIKEVILHAGIYCGLPAANEAFHSAIEVFVELGLK